MYINLSVCMRLYWGLSSLWIIGARMESGYEGISAAMAESRPMGTTESNWCSVVDGGTGTCITGILLGKSIGILPIQAALSIILCSQPLLRANITNKEGKLCFDIKDDTLVDVEIVNQDDLPPESIDRGQETWLQILENEMNTQFPLEKPLRVIQAHLYCLPNTNSLIILKLHPSAADHASATYISSQLLKHLHYYAMVEEKGEVLQDLIDKRRNLDQDNIMDLQIPALEDAIPPGKARKPFWAHGIDVLGYGLNAFRHAILPLEDVVEKRESRLILADFSQSATQNIVEMCNRKSSDLNGLLNAASLKAVAKFKGTGDRGEHYASVVLLNCRSMLEPVISDSTAGFYHSAILKTIHVTETISLWELATKFTREFNEAVKNRKHFTDMGDINMLMVQAIAHPALTLSSSMRTSLITNLYDPPRQAIDDEVASSLNLRECVTCSSINGVGPCLAMYPSFKNDCLRVSFVYCTPLFSAETMQTLVGYVSSMLNNLDP